MRILEDPISDPQWAALLERHPAASIFHTPGWLNALRQTYGYHPFVITASAGSSLDNGLVVCQANSWVSRRLVSVPFSDHCDPLVNGGPELNEMLASLKNHARTTRSSSIELRPAVADTPGFKAAAASCELEPENKYCLHRLDLRADAADIFRRFHHSSTRRAVRRAEREGLTCDAGTSNRLLLDFYRLLRMTRRRHGLPPQPLVWFRNLVTCLGERLTIHVARKDSEPIASVITLSFKNTLVYKYGGSDAAHHRLGAMPFVFWHVIQDAKRRGFEQLDLGRSDLEQVGLIEFKRHLGAAESPLTYYRHPARPPASAASRWSSVVARRVLARLPDPALDAAGRLLYKHLG